VSAEAYCALGGGAVVPAMVARALADTHGLRAWAPPRAPPVDEAAKRVLVGVLLDVYMRGGCGLPPPACPPRSRAPHSGANAARTAQLLDAQAMSVDVLDVRPAPARACGRPLTARPHRCSRRCRTTGRSRA
jgi:hypothetical protein